MIIEQYNLLINEWNDKFNLFMWNFLESLDLWIKKGKGKSLLLIFLYCHMCMYILIDLSINHVTKWRKCLISSLLFMHIFFFSGSTAATCQKQQHIQTFFFSPGRRTTKRLILLVKNSDSCATMGREKRRKECHRNNDWQWKDYKRRM